MDFQQSISSLKFATNSNNDEQETNSEQIPEHALYGKAPDQSSKHLLQAI